MTTTDIIKQVKKLCNGKIKVTAIRFDHWFKFPKKEQSFSIVIYYIFENKKSNFSVDLFHHGPQTTEFLFSKVIEKIAEITGKPYSKESKNLTDGLTCNLEAENCKS
jgi:hypothetical protein